MYAVDLATQKILWTSKYFGSEAHAFNYGAVPHPDNGIIYYPGGAAPATLIALNSTNGAVIFQANLVRSPIGTDRFDIMTIIFLGGEVIIIIIMIIIMIITIIIFSSFLNVLLLIFFTIQLDTNDMEQAWK